MFRTRRYMKELAAQRDFNTSYAKNNDSVHPEHECNSNCSFNKRVSQDSNDHNNNNNPNFCRRQDVINGSWISVTISNPPYFPKNEHLRCYPNEAYIGPTWQTHRWQPHRTNCTFSEWNQSDFCSLMSLGTILISGDSLSWEQYSSLAQLLGLRVHQSSQFWSKENHQNHIQYGCRKQTRLVFRRDDILSNLTSTIMDSFPQVIVLNRGAHYQNDTALMAGIWHNIWEIQRWKAKCHESGMKCHLFWRTSVPGHPLCGQLNFTHPNNDLAAMEAWINNRSNYDDDTIKYHWYDYQHQNNMILDALREGLGDDGFEVLDAYYLNVLRPDEHRAHQGDCLHNCYPGKMDVYNQLLLHYLRVQRSWEDVDHLQQLYAQSRSRANNVDINASSQEG